MTLKELQIALRTHNLSVNQKDTDKVYVEDHHGSLHELVSVEDESGEGYGPIVVLKYAREEVDF